MIGNLNRKVKKVFSTKTLEKGLLLGLSGLMLGGTAVSVFTPENIEAYNNGGRDEMKDFISKVQNDVPKDEVVGTLENTRPTDYEHNKHIAGGDFYSNYYNFMVREFKKSNSQKGMVGQTALAQGWLWAKNPNRAEIDLGFSIHWYLNRMDLYKENANGSVGSKLNGANGVIVYCLSPTVPRGFNELRVYEDDRLGGRFYKHLNNNSGRVWGRANSTTKETIKKAAYYGFGYNGNLDRMTYLVAQEQIWESMRFADFDYVQGKLDPTKGFVSTNLRVINNNIDINQNTKPYLTWSNLGGYMTLSHMRSVRTKMLGYMANHKDPSQLAANKKQYNVSGLGVERKINMGQDISGFNFRAGKGVSVRKGTGGDRSSIFVKINSNDYHPTVRFESGDSKEHQAFSTSTFVWEGIYKDGTVNRFGQNSKYVFGTRTDLWGSSAAAKKAQKQLYVQPLFTIGQDQISGDFKLRLNTGDLRIKKLETGTSKGARGVSFKVERLNSNNTVAKVITNRTTTDSNGNITIKNLEEGRYRVTEIDAASPYRFVNQNKIVTVSPAKTNEVTFNNPRVKNNLKIVSKDGVTGKVLPNVSFNVSGAKNQNVKTDGNGQVTMWDVPFGSYTAVDTAVPKPYLIKKQKQSTSFAYNKNRADETKTLTYNFYPQKNELTVKLRNSENAAQGIPNAKFVVRGTSGDASGYRKEISTNGSGNFTLSNIPFGNYEITQVNAPSPYLRFKGKESASFTYNANGGEWNRVEKIIKNVPQKNDLVVIVRDKETNDPIPNAKVKITGNGYNNTVTTNSNGEYKVSNLKYGKYTLTQVSVPKPYLINKEIKESTFTHNFDGPERNVNKVTYLNTRQKNHMTISKRNIHTGAVVPNTVFDVKGVSGDASGFKRTVTTDKNGNVSLVDIPFGKYEIVETKVPMPYILDQTKKSMEFVYDTNGAEWIKQTHVMKNEVGPLVTIGIDEIRIDTKMKKDGLITDVKPAFNLDYDWSYKPATKDYVVRFNVVEKKSGKTVSHLDMTLLELSKTKNFEREITEKLISLDKGEKIDYSITLTTPEGKAIDKKMATIRNQELKTHAYTAKEKVYDLKVGKGGEIEIPDKLVVRTLAQYEKPLKEYTEKITLDVNPMKPLVTGYGFEYETTIRYSNELNNQNVKYDNKGKDVYVVEKDVDVDLHAHKYFVDEGYGFATIEDNKDFRRVPLFMKGKGVNNIDANKVQIIDLELGQSYLSKVEPLASEKEKDGYEYGGRKLYLPVWLTQDEVKDIAKNKKDFFIETEEMGINRIGFNVKDSTQTRAWMFNHKGSKTDDTILLIPADQNKFEKATKDRSNKVETKVLGKVE